MFSKQNILGRGHKHFVYDIFMVTGATLEQYLKGRMVDGQSWKSFILLDCKETQMSQNRGWNYKATKVFGKYVW